MFVEIFQCFFIMLFVDDAYINQQIIVDIQTEFCKRVYFPNITTWFFAHIDLFLSWKDGKYGKWKQNEYNKYFGRNKQHAYLISNVFN